MACKKQTVPFAGTPEQEAELKSVIAQLKDQPGALMPVMQKAQDIYGYLPIEVQTMISDEMGIPLEKVYGVSTFYAQFALQPKGKYLSVSVQHVTLKVPAKSSVNWKNCWASPTVNAQQMANSPWIPADVSVPADLLPS